MQTGQARWIWRQVGLSEHANRGWVNSLDPLSEENVDVSIRVTRAGGAHRSESHLKTEFVVIPALFVQFISKKGCGRVLPFFRFTQVTECVRQSAKGFENYSGFFRAQA